MNGTTVDLSPLHLREEQLIADFKAHSVLKNFDLASERVIHSVLLQRRFLSLAFTPIYDVAIDGLTDAESKNVARDIVREEYANPAATHREDLVSDLLSVGISKDRILGTPPTAETLAVVGDFFNMTFDDVLPAMRDVRLLTLLRFAEEVLVSIEYSCFWPRLQYLGLCQATATAAPDGKVSRFYHPHIHHDASTSGIHDVSGTARPASTHSDRLARCLKRSIEASGLAGVEDCLAAMDLSARVKRRFYDQFAVR